MRLAILAALLAISDFERGLALYRERSFASAEQAFRKALATRPKDLKARIYLARTLLEQGRAADALAQLELVLAAPSDPEILLEAGQFFRELAERRAAELGRAAPGSAAVHEINGERLEMAGRLEEARIEYSRAAELEPSRPGIHYRLGSVFWKQRQPDLASKALVAELARNPHHGMANLRLGEVLLSQGADAVDSLERAVAAMPSSADAKRELGKAYRKAGRQADAKRVWEEVAKSKPDDTQIHFLLGGLYRELGDADRARAEFEKHRRILESRRAQSETRTAN